MPRLYLPSIPQGGKTLRVTGEEARYLLSVLRMKVGDELEIFDSTGARFVAAVIKTGRSTIALEALRTLPPLAEPARRLVLLQGLLKGQKMDYVVQKTTELGVSEIVPLVAERSQVRQTSKLERWRKIAVEASRQSLRASVPSISGPVAFGEFFGRRAQLDGFIFWEEGGASLRSTKPAISEKPLLLAVGPEGGFTAGEVELARRSGLEVKTLGQRVLRAETAAVSAVTIAQFILGEMG